MEKRRDKILRVEAGRDFYFFLAILRVSLIQYVNIPCIHTQKCFYRNVIDKITSLV